VHALEFRIDGFSGSACISISIHHRVGGVIHAPAPAEHRFIREDFGALARQIIVDFVACRLALTTADAQSRIDEHAELVRRAFTGTR
jgi:hypothetical protein